MMDYRKHLHDAAPSLPLVEICPLALLTDPQGNLLMVRDQEDIYWHLMGGWLGPDETIRECLEEKYNAFPYVPFGKPEIVNCRYGNDANLIGALRFHLERMKEEN